MSLKYPDILEHNNPNNPLMDVNQLEGVSIINLLTERNIIPLAKRKGGHFVISKTEEKAYIYTGTTLNDIDWNNASNWTESGGSIDGTFISPTGININTITPHVVANAGDIGWNAVDGTFDMKLLSGVTLQAGQELYFYGKATEAISNGDCVQFAGVQGDHITIKKAVQSEIALNPMLIIGVATQNIASNDFGYVTGFGKINGIYTAGFSLGDLLYYDSSGTVAGRITKVIPVAPYRKILLATVIKLQTGVSENGIILVRPTFSSKLGDLDDVDGTATSMLDTDVVLKKEVSGIWKHITMANFKAFLSLVFRLKTETGDAHGFINPPNGGNFTVSNTGLSYTIGLLANAGAYKINGTDRANSGLSITTTVSLGQNFICINESSLVVSPIDIFDKSKTSVCTLYTDGTRYRLEDELHGAKRNLQTHYDEHASEGCRYINGGMLTVASGATNTFSITPSTIRDEDRWHTIGAKTQGQMMYRNAGLTLMTLDGPSTYYAKVSGGIPQYDNNGVITAIPVSNYGVTWVYATNSKLPVNSEIAFILGQGAYSSVALAQSAPQPQLLGASIAEWKLMYRIVYQRVGNALSYVQADDFRAQVTGLVVGDGAGLTQLLATQVTVTPPTGYTQIDQQSLDNDLAANTIKGATATHATIIDADTIGVWDSVGSVFKKASALAFKTYVKLGLKASEVLNDSTNVTGANLKTVLDNATLAIDGVTIQDADLFPIAREVEAPAGVFKSVNMYHTWDRIKSELVDKHVYQYNVSTWEEIQAVVSDPLCRESIVFNIMQPVNCGIMQTYAKNIYFRGAKIVMQSDANLWISGYVAGTYNIYLDCLLETGSLGMPAYITLGDTQVISTINLKIKQILGLSTSTVATVELIEIGASTTTTITYNELVNVQLLNTSITTTQENNFYALKEYTIHKSITVGGTYTGPYTLMSLPVGWYIDSIELRNASAQTITGAVIEIDDDNGGWIIINTLFNLVQNSYMIISRYTSIASVYDQYGSNNIFAYHVNNITATPKVVRYRATTMINTTTNIAITIKKGL